MIAVSATGPYGLAVFGGAFLLAALGPLAVLRLRESWGLTEKHLKGKAQRDTEEPHVYQQKLEADELDNSTR